MKMLCPKCHNEIPPDKINADTDIAFCPRCSEAYRLSQLVDADDSDLGTPPKGTWFITGIDNWEVGGTTRSLSAFLLVPFMCVWSGFLLNGIYGSQIWDHKFNLTLSLFGIFFILISIFFWSFALMCTCGQVRILCQHDQAEIFVGIGSIGWRRRFSWSQITKISEGLTSNPYYKIFTTGIKIQVQERVFTFGTMLNEERRTFLLRVLQRMRTSASLLAAGKII